MNCRDSEDHKRSKEGDNAAGMEKEGAEKKMNDGELEPNRIICCRHISLEIVSHQRGVENQSVDSKSLDGC